MNDERHMRHVSLLAELSAERAGVELLSGVVLDMAASLQAIEARSDDGGYARAALTKHAELLAELAPTEEAAVAPGERRTLNLRWLWITTQGGPIWLCIGGRKPLAHLPRWRRRLFHLPSIRWRLRRGKRP